MRYRFESFDQSFCYLFFGLLMTESDASLVIGGDVVFSAFVLLYLKQDRFQYPSLLSRIASIFSGLILSTIFPFYLV
jgi:hypothetical protein